MKTNDIREKFLSYFENNGHKRIQSSPLVPSNDPTLLFTNAGMVQFKDIFLGYEKSSTYRATTSQKCVRAGGKHNDLENVGYTARHHTFFEMLGNFSFGDYFKRDAINLAWKLITDGFGLDPSRLLVTVYHHDQEAYDIWKKDINLPLDKIIRIGDKPGGIKNRSDNFWQMGETGPCGPCSEIFWDHGKEIQGGPPGSPEEEGDRFIEIWNLVFMQYDRSESGVLKDLPKPSVDTGMGLERMAAVLQNVHSNYDIDMFKSLVAAAARYTGCDDIKSNSLKVIADHIRACSFLISDGVIPGNEGRGYVLRRIIRRAVRHGNKLGQKAPFFYRLVEDLSTEMGVAYPELISSKREIASVLHQEEVRFSDTLEKGLESLEEAIIKGGKILNGDTIFKLYDTYGFPVDLTADIARERDLQVDLAGFEKAMEIQRSQGRASSKFQSDQNLDFSGADTVFEGYDKTDTWSTIEAIYQEGSPAELLAEHERAIIILDRTTFYAEAGGQIGDRGEIVGRDDSFIFKVEDTQMIKPNIIGHFGYLEKGIIELTKRASARVNKSLRRKATCNHSATHLLHAALRNTLGENVKQKGSLVDEFRARFDFSTDRPVSLKQIGLIENMVNEQILLGSGVVSSEMSYDKSIEFGALGLFGEKYGTVVRVVSMGDFSRELCGGTHVDSTSKIGLFKITSETSVAAGVRRIEAVTGKEALSYVQENEKKLNNIKLLLKSGKDDIEKKLNQIVEKNRLLEKTNSNLLKQLISFQSENLVGEAIQIEEIKVLTKLVENSNSNALRLILDEVKAKLQTAVIVLATIKDEHVLLVVGVTNNLTKSYKAGDLAAFLAKQVGGKGGGRANLGQGGGPNLSKLSDTLSSVIAWIEAK